MKNPNAPRNATGPTGGYTFEQSVDFLVNSANAIHFDWSRIGMNFPRNRMGFTSTELDKIHNPGDPIKYFPNLIYTHQSKFQPRAGGSNGAPSSFYINDSAGETHYMAPGRKNETANSTGGPQRPSGGCFHNGTESKASEGRQYTYGGADGDIDTSPDGVITTHDSYTMFVVYLPFVNGDGSGLSYPGATSADGTNKTTFSHRFNPSPGTDTDYVRINDVGTQFEIKVNNQTQVDVAINTEYDILSGVTSDGKIYAKKWDVNYYLSGAASNGNGKPVKEPIIWCIDVINDNATATMPSFRQFRRINDATAADYIRPQDRIEDHTTWWHVYDNDHTIDSYHTQIGASSIVGPGVWIYNQYGVLVGWESKQSSTGLGGGIQSQIGISYTGTAVPYNLHGYMCEQVTTTIPMSMKKKHLILKHLRHKWGIPDSYANGKPFHD